MHWTENRREGKLFVFSGINLAQARDGWRALISIVMNRLFQWNVEKFSSECVGYWRLLHKRVSVSIWSYFPSPFPSPFWRWSGTESITAEAITGLLYQPRMIMDIDECGAAGGKNGKGNRSTRRKPDPVPLCPPQIPHDPTRAFM
jgi:hypothetical protein